MKSGTRGRFKYQCEECSAFSWFRPQERRSRFGIRCTECGSRRLEPTKRSIAKEHDTESHSIKSYLDDQRRNKMEGVHV